MAETGAFVPLGAPLLSRRGIYSTRVVRGGAVQWGGFADASNHLAGRGCALIPHAMSGQDLTVGADETLKFWVWPRYAARRRLWVSTYINRASAVTGARVTFTDPNSGQSNADVSGIAGTRVVHQHVEDVGTPSATAGQLAPKWHLDSGASKAVTLLSVSCFELPRPDLVLDTNEYGVERDTLESGRPIFKGTGRGVGAVATAVQALDAVAARNGIFHFARDTSAQLSTTAGAWTPVFLSPPVGLGRKRYTTSTTATVSVYARCSSGAGTTGDLRFTMASGATLTLSITSAMSSSWLNGSLAIDCEDLTVADGRRSSRYDTCTVEWQRTAGANAINLESISIGNG